MFLNFCRGKKKKRIKIFIKILKTVLRPSCQVVPENWHQLNLMSLEILKCKWIEKTHVKHGAFGKFISPSKKRSKRFKIFEIFFSLLMTVISGFELRKPQNL